MRGDKGLQQIGRLSAGGLLRGQSIPEQLECRLRGRRMEIRSMQLGGKTPGQRQRSSSSWPAKGQERQPEVRPRLTTFSAPIHPFLFFADTNTTIITSSRTRENSSTNSSLFKRSGNCSSNRSRSKISRSCLSCAPCSSGKEKKKKNRNLTIRYREERITTRYERGNSTGTASTFRTRTRTQSCTRIPRVLRP